MQTKDQGYYNTGWFNPKMSSRATFWFCQQSRFQITWLFIWFIILNRHCYLKPTLPSLDGSWGFVEIYCLYSCQSWNLDFILEMPNWNWVNIERRALNHFKIECRNFKGCGVLTQTDSVMFNWSFLDSKYKTSEPRGHS